MSVSASTTPVRRSDRLRTMIGLTVAAALVLAIVLPNLRLTIYAGISWIAAIGLLWRTRTNDLQPRGAWRVLGVLLVLCAAAATTRLVAGPAATSTAILDWAVRGCALPGLYLLLRNTNATITRSRVRWIEWLLAAGSIGTVAAQLGQMHAIPPGFGLATVALTIPFDVTLALLLIRLLVVRSYLPGSIRTLMWGGAALALYDLSTVVAGGHDTHHATALVGVAAMGLVLDGLSRRSVSFSFASVDLYPTPTGSLRLLAMLPLISAPAALWALGSAHVLPATSAGFVAAAQAAIMLSALLLGLQSLRAAEELAEHDVITGLINRRGLPRVTQKLLSARESSSRASLAVVDLDGFKQVNDRYGHDVGDELLRAVAQRLRAAVGRSGVVCRVGGDEFVVVYLEDNADTRPTVHTKSLVQRLSSCLDRPCAVGGLQIQTAASIGVTPLNRATDLVQVMANSDAAMYAAKAAGKVDRAAGPKSRPASAHQDDSAAAAS